MIGVVRVLCVLGVLSLVAATGCGREDDTPEGAVRLLLQAAERIEPEKVYGLLARVTREELRRRAELATSQTGGRHQVSPASMMILGLTKPQLDVASVELVEVQGDTARVRIKAVKRGISETWQLRKEDERWRVVLPLNPS